MYQFCFIRKVDLVEEGALMPVELIITISHCNVQAHHSLPLFGGFIYINCHNTHTQVMMSWVGFVDVYIVPDRYFSRYPLGYASLHLIRTPGNFTFNP